MLYSKFIPNQTKISPWQSLMQMAWYSSNEMMFLLYKESIKRFAEGICYGIFKSTNRSLKKGSGLLY
jgi:hypothetical protein